MVKIPDGFNVSWLPNPVEFVRLWGDGTVDVGADRYLIAKYIVEGKTKEELIEYISNMLIGIQSLGRRVMTEDLVSRLVKEVRNDG